MAAMEKVFGNFNQWLEFMNWLKDSDKPELLYYVRGWCSRCQDSNTSYVIGHFGEDNDKWLLENYPKEWLTNQINDNIELQELCGLRE